MENVSVSVFAVGWRSKDAFEQINTRLPRLINSIKNLWHNYPMRLEMCSKKNKIIFKISVRHFMSETAHSRLFNLLNVFFFDNKKIFIVENFKTKSEFKICVDNLYMVYYSDSDLEN